MIPQLFIYSVRTLIRSVSPFIGIQLSFLMLLTVNCFSAFAGMNPISGTTLFINEIHYENGGVAGVHEGVELINTSSNHCDLSSYSIVLCDGSDGDVYNTIFLSAYGTLSPLGAVFVSIPGMENGPDGVALVKGDHVIQFLSYGGVVIGTSGPILGKQSVDIGVFELLTPPEYSLQLSGNGRVYEDFVWAPATGTPDALNMGQKITAIFQPPAPPTDPTSIMYTQEDLYSRLATGLVGTKSPSFTDPTSGPGNYGHTRDEVMAVMPGKDNSTGVYPEHVMAGWKYWGLTDGKWGLQIGSMPNVGQQNIAPITSNQLIAEGFHDDTGFVAGDNDLIPDNIAYGIDIFGVVGINTSLVNTSSGDAEASDVLAGKKGWASGNEKTGTMANIGQQNITPDTTIQTITQGYHNGTANVDGDADLLRENIISGVTIFGVAGNTNVVNTASGDAAATDLLIGSKAWADGVEITGTASLVNTPTSCSGTIHNAIGGGTRWCDNGDGTVTDMTTGLVWLQNADCTGYQNVDWSTAISKPITDLKSGLCGLSDGSVLGDWRLPTITELRGLANGHEVVRHYSQRAFIGMASDMYWTTFFYDSMAGTALAFPFADYNGGYYTKADLFRVLPVRGGQYPHLPPPCDSSDILLCIMPSDCTDAGGNWWSDNTCLGVQEPYTVVSAGQVWMDRNLGASRVAISEYDTAAYGDLYQWGRGPDGHEKSTSGITSATSSTDDPGHGDFITVEGYGNGEDWRVPQNDNLWQGLSGTNNPCPAGFRLPTETELTTEFLSWGSPDSSGAFASPLKLVPAGRRQWVDGDNPGGGGSYWSSSVNGTDARFLFFGGNVIMNSYYRSDGRSVRCIKD